MKLLFTGACLLLVLAVDGAKKMNVNCEKLERKCDKGSGKACRKLGKLCSDLLNRQEDSDGSSRQGPRIPAGMTSSTLGAPGGILVELHGTSIEVTWLPPENDAPVSGYMLGYGEYIPDVVIVRLSAVVTNYVIENVSPNVIYIIKLRTVDTNGYHGPSIYQTIMTTEASELPETPDRNIPGQRVETTDEETTNNDGEPTENREGQNSAVFNIRQNFGTTAIPAGGRDGSHETS